MGLDGAQVQPAALSVCPPRFLKEALSVGRFKKFKKRIIRLEGTHLSAAERLRVQTNGGRSTALNWGLENKHLLEPVQMFQASVAADCRTPLRQKP